jgi:hypothetical protein
VVFSQDIPSQSLGFIDAHASVLEISVAGHDLTIHQSPGLLKSTRKEGTTGAGRSCFFCHSAYIKSLLVYCSFTSLDPITLLWACIIKMLTHSPTHPTFLLFKPHTY